MVIESQLLLSKWERLNFLPELYLNLKIKYMTTHAYHIHTNQGTGTAENSCKEMCCGAGVGP